MEIKTKYDIVYRVIPNMQCNDFNNEPTYKIVKYEIDHKNNKMRNCGWNDWHKIKNDYYKTLEEAEQKLKEINDENR